MAIPISEYIDITTNSVVETVGTRHFTGLAFSKSSMKNQTAGTTYAEMKTDYDAGKPVLITQTDVASLFEENAPIYAFAMKYFGYSGKPGKLYVAKVLVAEGTTEALTTAYTRVIGYEQDFGSFTFVGAYGLAEFSRANLKAVATANAGNGFLFVVPTTETDVSLDVGDNGFKGIVGTHLVMDKLTLNPDDYTEFSSSSTYVVGAKVKRSVSGSYADYFSCHTAVTSPGTWEEVSAKFTSEVYANLGAWMPMAWYGSVNYENTNASSTMDYKEFGGVVPTVTTLESKTSMDAAKVNYVGLVQIHGTKIQFYQQGVNMDGEDIGNYRDMIWLKGEVERGWFNLVTNAKIPANSDGANTVSAMVTSVAESAVDNGVILLDKPISTTKRNLVNAYANDTSAATQVITSGYYVAAKIVPDGTRYVCQYTLVYAKGDHIGKVVGTHNLV